MRQGPSFYSGANRSMRSNCMARGFPVASLFLRNRSCHRVRVHRAPETVILRGQQKLKIALICEHIPYDKKTSAIGTLGGCASLSSLVFTLEASSAWFSVS